MAIPKGAKVFNVVRENSSKVYMETIPQATSDNINTISNILFNDAYQPMLNEFVTNLINRIALTIVRNHIDYCVYHNINMLSELNLKEE